MEKVNIGNKTLTLENIENKNKIHFFLFDNDKKYEMEEKIENLFELFEEDLLKNINNYEFEIKECSNQKEGSNQNEMELKIKSKKNGKKNALILKCKNKNDTTTGNPAPAINPEPISNGNDLENRIKEIKESYNNTLKEIKEKNKQLMKENEELQKEIDKEKRKNDEILRVYFENREKYENAVKKNSEIAELQSKL